MQPAKKHFDPKMPQPTFLLKCGALFLLFLTSVLIVACGTNANSMAGDEGPQVTVTINFNNRTPIPTAPPITCSAWVTNASPAFAPGAKMTVNMKFVRNNNGIPVGIEGASAVSTIIWADGSATTLATAQTTSDGLAVAYFELPNNAGLVGRNNSVTVVFTAPDGTSCTVDKDRAAYFTMIAVTPTPSPTPSPSPGANPSPGVTPSPGMTPSPVGIELSPIPILTPGQNR